MLSLIWRNRLGGESYMKTADHFFRIIKYRSLLGIGLMGLGLAIFAFSQENRNLYQNEESQGESKVKPFKIRVGVEEVRIDAVALDGNGHQITDLTAADFEIYQDGKLQEITSSTYISDQSVRPGLGSNNDENSRHVPPKASVSVITRDQVRRTITFIVDNITMSFEQVDHARMALRKFVQDQMQPGDLVSILPTSSGNAEFLMFTAEKKHLLAAIDNIKWYKYPHLIKKIFPQYPAIMFAVRALRDMPGRKALIAITPQILVPRTVIKSLDDPLGPPVDESMFMYTMEQVADQALRAGVVIHTLDISGLITDDSLDWSVRSAILMELAKGERKERTQSLSDAMRASPELFGPLANQDRDAAEQAHLAAMMDQNSRVPLSQKTGGILLTDNNFFVDGIGAANEELKGYYLLSYIPPPDTFGPSSGDKYHRLKINVKRPGAEVHHRDGFYGTTETAEIAAEYRDALLDALISPFQHNDLLIQLTAGFIEDPKKGYLLKAWMHLNGSQASFTEENNETFIKLNTSAVTTDVSGIIQDAGRETYTIKVKKEQLAFIREHGISFSMEIAAKKPGTYYVRVAVQDKGSGKLGSAYQFVDIPDLKNGQLALSNIFAGQSMAEKPRVLRNYRVGETLDYSTVIYNGLSKKQKAPELESHFVLYRNGAEVAQSKPETVELEGVKDYKRIAIKKSLPLDLTLPPGEYLLEFVVENKKADKKQNSVSQALDFNLVAQ
jgi:VWFA-related protein